MGGQSSSTQTQQSQSAPWKAAQPMLQGILGQLGVGLDFAEIHSQPDRFVLFRQAGFRKHRADYQAMSGLDGPDVRAIVVETLAEQQRLHRDDIDAVVLKSVATVLTSFGIEEEDRKELRADFQHLRRWRRSVEQAQSYTFKAVITVIVTGFVGAVWLGIKATLGK